jgi:hypothetical protein
MIDDLFEDSDEIEAVVLEGGYGIGSFSLQYQLLDGVLRLLWRLQTTAGMVNVAGRGSRHGACCGASRRR